MSALTSYQVRAINILGPRGGLKPVWKIDEGPPYYREVAVFTSRRAALAALAELVNAAHAARHGGGELDA